MPEVLEPGWVRGDLGAARYLSMDRKTWVKLRRNHKLRPSMVGRSRRFECAELDRLMRKLRQESGSDLLRPALARRNRERKSTVLNPPTVNQP